MAARGQLAATVAQRPYLLGWICASRLGSASLSDYGLAAKQLCLAACNINVHGQSINDIRAKSRHEWATAKAMLMVEQDAQVLLSYALPVALHKLADWDAWTFSQLQAVQARLLVDGVIYREDSSSVGASVWLA